MYIDCYTEFHDYFIKIYQTLEEAHHMLLKHLSSNDTSAILEQAQQLMMEAGNRLEHTMESNVTEIIHAMEQYCELLYNISQNPIDLQEDVQEIDTILNQIKHKIENISTNHNKLSFVLIIKNEAAYIQEWIEFHKKVGVDHFYIYDNGSTDQIKEELKTYINEGIVTYRYYPGHMMQDHAYNDALKQYAYQTKYMGFIDIDEFVMPVSNSEKLPQIIDQLLMMDQKAEGICINWRLYGSSGKEHYEPEYVTKRFLTRAEDSFEKNAHIKTICNPRKVSYFANPHFPLYGNGCYSINENGLKVIGPFNDQNTCNKIRINHYFTKSKDEFIDKIHRGKADGNDLRQLSEFTIHDQNQVYDDIALRYWT